MATGEHVSFRIGEVHLGLEVLGEEVTGFSASPTGIVRAIAAYGRREDGLRIGVIRASSDELEHPELLTTLSSEAPDPHGISTGNGQLFNAIEVGVESRSPQTVMVPIGSGDIAEILPALDDSLTDLAGRIDAISA